MRSHSPLHHHSRARRTAVASLVAGLLTTVLVGGTAQAAVAGPQAASGAATTLRVSVPARTTAGHDVPVTVEAVDSRGRTARDYRGTVTLTSTSVAGGLPASYTFSARDRGARTFARVSVRSAGTTTVTVTDPALRTPSATSRPVAVTAGRAQRLLVQAAGDVVAGAPTGLTVTAVDAWGNVDTTYAGTVALSSTDTAAGASIEPRRYRFGRADAGTATLAGGRGVVLVTPGPQTVTATDTQRRAVTGSTTVQVAPAAPQPVTVAGREAYGWGMDISGALGDGGENEYATQDLRAVDGGAVWRQVAAGAFTSAGIRADGSLWVWGSASQDGAPADLDRPTRLGADADWAVVAPPYAVKRDGTLWTWQDETGRPGALTRVGTDAGWAQVAAGAGYAIGLRTDGTLWSWGSQNHWGQLGTGTTEPHAEPRQIGTAGDWASISVHLHQSVAIKKDGTLWGWGLDPADTLTEDDAREPRTAPVQIGTDADWAVVDAGYLHTAALKRDGTLWSWGLNTLGALGDGTTTSSALPVQEARHAVWTSVAAGDGLTAAVAADGTLWRWGNRELGAPSPETPHPTPERVGTAAGWATVTAGDQDHVLALRG